MFDGSCCLQVHSQFSETPLLWIKFETKRENHFSIAEPEYIVQSILGGSPWEMMSQLGPPEVEPESLEIDRLEHTQPQKTYPETKGLQNKFDWNTAPESETICMDFLPIWHYRDGKYRSQHSNGPWVHTPPSAISNRPCAPRGNPSHLQAGCGKRGWIGLAWAGCWCLPKENPKTDNYMTKKTNHHLQFVCHSTWHVVMAVDCLQSHGWDVYHHIKPWTCGRWWTTKNNFYTPKYNFDIVFESLAQIL